FQPQGVDAALGDGAHGDIVAGEDAGDAIAVAGRQRAGYQSPISAPPYRVRRIGIATSWTGAPVPTSDPGRPDVRPRHALASVSLRATRAAPKVRRATPANRLAPAGRSATAAIVAAASSRIDGDHVSCHSSARRPVLGRPPRRAG